MEIKVEDLMNQCEYCNGQGFIHDWQWAQWWSENQSPPPKGHRLMSIQEEVPCEHCQEIGFLPTSQGKAILEFIARFRGRR